MPATTFPFTLIAPPCSPRIPLTCVALPPLRARAQQQQDGPSPDQQEMFQQMQQARDQMASGAFDPADFQKQLVDKGLIDQDLVDKMQTTMQRVTVGTLKERLGASDDDWKIIQPKLQKVVALRGATGQGGGAGGFGMMGIMGGAAQSPAATDVSKAMRELRNALKDEKAKTEEIGAKLQAWRDARERAKSELTKAQADLIGILTARQEGVLLTMGFIQ